MLSHFSHVPTLWTVADQAPLSLGFSRQEHWSRLPCPSPGHLPDPGMEPTSVSYTSCLGRRVRLPLALPGKPSGSLSKFHILKKVKVKSPSRIRLFATPWTVTYQAPLTMEFSRQECWSGLPFPSLGDLPNPGIEPRSPALQADALPSEPPGKLK